MELGASSLVFPKLPQRQEPVYGGEELRREYHKRPRNQPDVPAFLRK